jgi:uncharacterized protein YktB (UPF0637 family)
MDFTGFSPEVFEVFRVPGFDERMALLRTVVRPRLTALGERLTPALAAVAGDALYPHVAKHLRRRVNPPEDTWVAFGPSPRGYKATPHFEVGVSRDAVFARFVIKPEGQAQKPVFFDRVTWREVLALPDPARTFWYRGDHGQDPLPLLELDAGLWSVLRDHAMKPANSIAVGRVIAREDPDVGKPILADRLLAMLADLAPLYRAAVNRVTA